MSRVRAPSIALFSSLPIKGKILYISDISDILEVPLNCVRGLLTKDPHTTHYLFSYVGQRENSMPATERTRTFFDIKCHSEILAILLSIFLVSQSLALCTFSAQISGHNILGLYGHVTAAIWYILFGPVSFIGILALGFLNFLLYVKNFSFFTVKRLASLVLILFSLSMFLVLLKSLFPGLEFAWRELIGASPEYAWLYKLGGLPMEVLYLGLPYINFMNLFNVIGTALIATSVLFLSLLTFFNLEIEALPSFLRKQEKKTPFKEKDTGTQGREDKKIQSLPIETRIHIASEPPEQEEVSSLPFLSKIKAAPQKNRSAAPLDLSTYHLPPSHLLTQPKECDLSDIKKELQEKAARLEETLLSFGIEAKVGEIHCGPRITLYEVHPAVGVKVGKIKTLEHDIALNMKAKSIRIIAPIPGKAAVGIEIPNHKSQEVSFRELLEMYHKQPSPHKIPMILGKAVNGDPVITDLTKMPHCIIAGATGSGKSVCINSIIMSILMLMKPDEVRLLMVDPKKVELTPYSHLPHMIAPVITDTYDAAQAMNWLVKEMEYRYELLKQTGQRNIESFNKRTVNKEAEEASLMPIPASLFYIVAIVDELADLMMASTQDIETPITRIAQMARAVGIHLILATQRPSREVITGLIKANFPSRISFKVASRINSQIVLDDTGAELLLGNGDMLILLPGLSHFIRAQGAFVRDDEIQAVVHQIEQQAGPKYLINSFGKGEKTIDRDDSLEEELDQLFEDAKEIVLSTGNASTTFLQRKLKIGYARAASIMDQLELQGVIGPQEGAKPRKIFYPKGTEPEPLDPLPPPEEASPET